MINFSLRLVGKIVLLRPMESTDYDEFINLTSDEKLWFYFTSDLSKREQLQKWVDNSISQLHDKTRLPFTIIEQTSNRVIGSTSFGNISELDRRIEIGWTWIAKNYQGTGINKEIKYLMLKHCFEEVKFERVEFKTDVLNKAARKALLNLGIVEEGVLRSHTLMINNRRRDTIYYGVLKSEWERIKNKNNWR